MPGAVMNASYPDQGPPLLEARGVSFLRNEDTIFGPLDLHVRGGEALLVHGGNGSGKTTLLRMLAGLLPPAAGSICIAGAPASAESVARASALLGHLLGHKGELTVEENLRFAVALCGCRRGIGIASALASVGLAGFEDAPARSLSAGQKKRLALARMLLVPA